MSILIVDDNSDMRRAMQLLAEHHGYAAQTADSGAAALAALQAGLRPCLILLDLRMPNMNGFEFRRQQLLDPALAQIPVVLLSAASIRPEDVPELGVAQVLLKGDDPQLLVQTIAAHCPHCTARRSARVKKRT